jgi:low density lipoprotein receptor-related protein 5/6
MKRIFFVLTTLGLFLGSTGQARSDFIYWVDQDEGGVHRASLDGSGHVILPPGHPRGTGIALDITAGKMYWTGQSADQIVRANLDGTGWQELLKPHAPYGIAVDIVAGKMYWTGGLVGKNIRRANLDGTGEEALVTGQHSPTGIALDVAAGKMYWSNQFGQTIWRPNLDGTG